MVAISPTMVIATSHGTAIDAIQCKRHVLQREQGTRPCPHESVSALHVDTTNLPTYTGTLDHHTPCELVRVP